MFIEKIGCSSGKLGSNAKKNGMEKTLQQAKVITRRSQRTLKGLINLMVNFSLTLIGLPISS